MRKEEIAVIFAVLIVGVILVANCLGTAFFLSDSICSDLIR